MNERMDGWRTEGLVDGPSLEVVESVILGYMDGHGGRDLSPVYISAWKER